MAKFVPQSPRGSRGTGGRLLSVNFGVSGLKQAKVDMGLAYKRVRNLMPVWRQIHNGHPRNPPMGFMNFVQVMRKRFETKGVFGGNPWQRYLGVEGLYLIIVKAPRLRASKAWDGEPMLRWTKSKSATPRQKERLYPSFVKVKHPEHVFEASPKQARMGSRVPYAHLHHRGIGQYMVAGKGYSPPKRILISIPELVLKSWVKLIQKHVIRKYGPSARRNL